MASSLASSIGLRPGSTSTEKPSLILRVRPAATPRATIGSGQSPVTRSESQSESNRAASSPVTRAAKRSGSLDARVPSP